MLPQQPDLLPQVLDFPFARQHALGARLPGGHAHPTGTEPLALRGDDRGVRIQAPCLRQGRVQLLTLGDGIAGGLFHLLRLGAELIGMTNGQTWCGRYAMDCVWIV